MSACHDANRMNHDSYDTDYIREILRGVKTIALVGASANSVRPSYLVMKYLMEKGYTVFPVNPGLAGQHLLGQPVHATLADIPTAIDMVDIFRNAEAAATITDEAIALPKKPKVIWMQLQVRNDDAAARAEAAGMKVVMNRCPKMEYGKISGEWGWVGGDPGFISSKRQHLHESGRVQSLGLGPGLGQKNT
jgi:predicted CoA-binding protein